MLGDYQEEIEIRPKWIIIDDALALVALLDLVGPQSDCVSHIHQPRPPKEPLFWMPQNSDYFATSACFSKLRMFHISLVALGGPIRLCHIHQPFDPGQDPPGAFSRPSTEFGNIISDVNIKDIGDIFAKVHTPTLLSSSSVAKYQIFLLF